MPVKWTTPTEVGKGKQNKTKQKNKNKKNLQNKSKHKNNKCFPWVTALKVLPLSVSHSPPHLPRISSNTGGPYLWNCCRESSDSKLVLLCVLASNVHSYQNWSIFFCGSSQCLFIYSIDTKASRSRLNHVDLICSLYSWWEGLESSSLATLPLGFNCGFISTSAWGSSTGVWSCGFPRGLGFAPVRAMCGGGAAAWVSGVLAAPGTQGGWRFGQKGI